MVEPKRLVTFAAFCSNVCAGFLFRRSSWWEARDARPVQPPTRHSEELQILTDVSQFWIRGSVCRSRLRSKQRIGWLTFASQPLTSWSLLSSHDGTPGFVRRRLIRLLDAIVPWPPELDQPDRGETGRVTSTLPLRSHSRHPRAEGGDPWLNPRSTSSG